MNLNSYKITFIENRGFSKSKEIKEINYQYNSKQEARKAFNAVFGLWCDIVEIVKI